MNSLTPGEMTTEALKLYNDGLFPEAVALFKNAASLGDPGAQHLLGLMYEVGDQIEKNYAEAIKLQISASKQGNQYAQAHLGGVYVHGLLNQDIDYEKAAYWFLKSAEQGNVSALCDLGNMHSYGLHFPQDNKKPSHTMRRRQD